jgi:hypothetical protein
MDSKCMTLPVDCGYNVEDFQREWVCAFSDFFEYRGFQKDDSE